MDKQKNNLIKYWKDENIVKHDSVIKAFKKIPRENFVLKKYKKESYSDCPLDIGFNVTISQPTTVVIMLDNLNVEKGNKVLEIGTGSGYTAALLSVLVGNEGKVYSVELIKELVDFSKKNLDKINIKNIEVFCGNGIKGLKKYATYDRIILHAAAEKIPNKLLEQLKNDGIFIGPIGKYYSQNLIKITKKKNKFIEENLGDFIFVPLKN